MLHLDLSDATQAEITAAAEGVRASRGEDAAESFTIRVAEVFATELARVA